MVECGFEGALRGEFIGTDCRHLLSVSTSDQDAPVRKVSYFFAEKLGYRVAGVWKETVQVIETIVNNGKKF